MNAMSKLFVLGCLTVVASSAPQADAQKYPDRPVHLVVPYPPGTATDVLSRTVADKLSAAWGQPVVVENQPGANGTTATGVVARAKPDGYTLIMIAANHVINASLYRSLPFDDLKDFRSIARIGNAAFVLCVNPSLPVKTVGELVALAKQQPGKLNYSSPSNGSPGHLGMEMLRTMSGVNLVHVPYKGAAQATTDLIGGQVQAGFIVESSAIPHIKSGKLNALAISSATRSAKLPDLPTVAEAGYPSFDVVSWIGLAAPAQIPVDIVDKISAEVIRIVNTPEVRERIVGLGLTPFPAASEEFGRYMASEHVKWASVVKDSGATLD